jgi:aspartate beta-hydroxylase
MTFMDGSDKGVLHYILFSKGKKNSKNCKKARRTCALLETFPEAAGCRQGTVKFSSMPPHAHVPAHVGSTNAKLQILVALDMDVEGGVRIRVAEDTK